MNKSAIKNGIKWVWLAAVIGFVIAYTVVKRDLAVQALSMISVSTLLYSAALILCAKLCLVANMRIAAMRFSIPLGWRECYTIYNTTQLAKYIPGSIWQFVGRISILHARGSNAKDIRDSLVAEHVWVLATAVMLAGILVYRKMQAFWEGRFAHLDTYPWHNAFLLVLVGMIAAGILVLTFKPQLLRWGTRMLPPLMAVPILVATWVFLGASLWVTLAPFAWTHPSLAYTVGAYCFSFFSGFLVPFSPAGLGIREAVLMFCLTPYMQADIALLLAAINRIIYFAVEVVLVMPSLAGKVLGPKETIS